MCPTTGLAPAAWDDEGRQAYARRQAALAETYGIEITSNVVTVEDYGDVHYLTAGPSDGTPVVFLHGVGTTAATWVPLLPAVAEEYRLIVPDRPGIGLSAPLDYGEGSFRRRLVEYLPALLETLDVTDAAVVGNSLGGLQAFLLALDTEYVTTLVLVGGPAGLTRSFPLPFRLLTIRGLDRVLERVTSTGDPVETARTQIERIGVVDTSAIPESFYEVLAANNALEEQTRSLRTLNRRAGSFGRMHPLYDITDEIKNLTVPTTFIWGEQDAFFDPSVGRPVVQAMTDASLHVLPEHGHMPWLEPSNEVASMLGTALGE